MTFSSVPIENSIVEPHHRALVEKIPPEQYKAYLEGFAENLSGSVADLVREAVRCLARERGHTAPPLT